MSARPVTSEPRGAAATARRYLGMLFNDRLALAAAIILAVLILGSFLGPYFVPKALVTLNFKTRLAPPPFPDFGFLGLMGTDALGRSMLGRLVLAGQTTLTIALVSAFLAALLGSTLGVAGGYRGGWAEALIMRAADVILSFPMLLLAIAFLYILKPSITNVIIILVIGRMPLYVRVARAETMEIKRRLFVDAARCLGASSLRICVTEIAPVLAPTILTLVALDVGLLMLTESSLSFLGIGIQPPAMSWGLMVAEGRQYIGSAWWMTLFPGLAIFLTALCCNLLANWLRLAFDPMQRWRLERRAPATPVADGNPRRSLRASPGRALMAGIAPLSSNGPVVPPAAAGPVLDVHDLRVEFRTENSTAYALRGVSFSVARGETLVIVGESGSGKSVTAEAILGILPSPPARITDGSIHFDGRDLLTMPVAGRRKLQGDRMTMVFQDALAALNPVFSVGWQIAELFRVHRGLSMREGRKRAVDLLRRVEIPNPEERAGQFAHQMSGGMRQRVMIAMAIALEPDVLLADEPTTALDVTVQAQIMQLLARLRNQTGLALVLITHDIAMASEVGDRIAVMYAGRIVETGPMADILSHPAHPYTFALVALARQEHAGERRPIKGSPIDLTRIPCGCAFRARCAFAVERCAVDDPALRTIGWQQIACHRAEAVLSATMGATNG